MSREVPEANRRRAMSLAAAVAALLATSVFGCSDDEVDPTPTSSSSSGSPAGGGGGQGAMPAGGAGGGGAGGGGEAGSGGVAQGCLETASDSTRGSAIAISPDDATLVVANREAGSVAVLDVDYTGGLPTLGRPTEIALGGEPWQVAVDACGERAYVVLRESQKLVEIGLEGRPTAAREVAVGSEPTAVALSPNNRLAFVANWVEGTVSAIDTATMTVDKTYDLNAVLAETGFLGASVSAATSRPALAHPRSLAVTNDGDGDDEDESVFVTEFFAQRTEAEAVDGSNADVNWVGIVYQIDLSDDGIETHALSSIADTGFANANLQPTGCFPNQLQSITIAAGRVYVTSICASPEGPVDPKTMTHPVVHVLDAVTGAEVAAPANLNEVLGDAFAGGFGLYPLVTNDLVFKPGTSDAYVIANGTDTAYRLAYDGGTIASVGGDNGAFIDLAPVDLDADLRGHNPIGIAVASSAPIAFVANEVSRNVTAVDIDPTQDEVAGLSAADPRVVRTAELPTDPAEQSRLRGKRFFQTGRDRWSLGGQGWGACQSCHFEGLSDNITWYFARGPRQSTSLDGSFASNDPTDQRIFNWTAVFDEIHDFENVARGLDGAVGALVHTLSDPPVNTDRINLADATLFPPAGSGGLNGSAEQVNDTVSVLQDWDDIEAYIQNIRSPRAPVGLAAADVAAGESLFVAARCDGCHGGAKWTLSRRFYAPSGPTNELLLTTPYDGAALVSAGFPAALLPAESGLQFMRSPNPKSGALDQIQCVLRPVGTFGVSPIDVGVVELRADMVSIGQGNEPSGRGFNVPSILGTQAGAPFFHAGNARTLEELLSSLFEEHHAALTSGFDPQGQDLSNLVAYLLSIDESSTPFALPLVGADGGDFCATP